jgi:glycosyltransferase involved in cell wall biosynthesis
LPKVSIISSLYNHEKFLERTFSSVLNQTYDDWEWILVDDGSQDRSYELACELSKKAPNKVKVLKHKDNKNHGQEATRNYACSIAQGDYLTLLDTDDFFAPRKLEVLVELLDKNPSVGLVYGMAKKFIDKENRYEPIFQSKTASGFCFSELIYDNFIPTISVMFRKKFFDQGLRFHSRYLTIGEWALWLEIAFESEIQFVPEVLGFWRQHSYNTGSRYELDAKKEIIDMKNDFLNDKKYSAYRKDILKALAKAHYDYAALLLQDLELNEMRRQCFKVLQNNEAQMNYKIKSFILIISSFFGKKINQKLSVFKNRLGGRV